MKAQRTYQPKAATCPEKWYVVDAQGQTLGRLASRVAKVLRGKTSPQFATHMHLNTHVIVVNADKVQLSGDKVKTKTYYTHSGYRTGIKAETVEKLLQRKPTEVVRRAVKGMIPKNALGRQMMRFLRVYAGTEHPHEAQNPESLKIVTRHVRVKE